MRIALVAAAVVSATVFGSLVSPPAQAYPICVCSKKDPPGMAQPRCGNALKIIEGPGGTYDFIEIGRGHTALSTDDYKVCNMDACAKVGAGLADAPVCPAPPVPPPVEAKENPERFAISGSATIGARLVPRLIAGYANAQDWRPSTDSCDPQIRLVPVTEPSRTALIINCRAAGSETGIPGLKAGDAEIAMLSRPITPAEIVGMRKDGYPHITTALQEHVLALDGVTVIASGRNSDPLPLNEIRTIFAGRRGDWQLYLLDEKSGTRESFEATVFADDRTSRLPSCNGGTVQCYSDPQEVVKAIANDPQGRGIGFVGSAYKDAPGVRSVAIRGECGIAQEPSVFEIKTEDYLFSRQLLLYTAKVRSLQASGFLFYAMSDNAQPVIRSAGFVDQTIERQEPEDGERRLMKYLQSPPREGGLEHPQKAMEDLHTTLKTAARLSISFRFRSDSTTFDTRAVQDLQRLADYLTFMDTRSKVVLVGFTDSNGDFKTNIDLSLNRARAVAGALQATGIEQNRIAVKPAGELMPVACNDSEAGRGKNRRVEVWVRP